MSPLSVIECQERSDALGVRRRCGADIAGWLLLELRVIEAGTTMAEVGLAERVMEAFAL